MQKHDHVWYPISWLVSDDKYPVVWACGAARACVVTATRTRTGRKGNYKHEEPQPQMENPYE